MRLPPHTHFARDVKQTELLSLVRAVAVGLFPTNSCPQRVPSAQGQEPPRTHRPDHFQPLTNIWGTGLEITAPKGAGSCGPAGRAAGRRALSPAPWLAWTRPLTLWKGRRPGWGSAGPCQLPTPSRCSCVTHCSPPLAWRELHVPETLGGSGPRHPHW